MTSASLSLHTPCRMRSAIPSSRDMEARPVKMGYKHLGNTGLKVSELCFGAMTFGTSERNSWGMPTCPERDCMLMLDRFYECGGNFIDTANVYGMGDSEKIIGNWCSSKDRDTLVLSTKVGHPTGAHVTMSGLSRRHVISCLEKSLKNLQTDYVDLYSCNVYDPETPIEETMRTFNDLVRCGKVRYIGLSNFASWHIAKAQECARRMGLEPVVCMQSQYSMLCRQAEWDVMPCCDSENMAFMAWSPLACGFLTGKYHRDMVTPTPGCRLSWSETMKTKGSPDWSSLCNEHTWQIVDKVCDVATKMGHTPAQVALRWVMQRPSVTCPIIGARSMKQLEENLGCCSFSLTDAQMEELNTVSHCEPPYPYCVTMPCSHGGGHHGLKQDRHVPHTMMHGVC